MVIGSRDGMWLRRMTRQGFKPIKIANVSPKKRQWLILHLIDMGVTLQGIKEMGATNEEIKEALQDLD